MLCPRTERESSKDWNIFHQSVHIIHFRGIFKIFPKDLFFFWPHSFYFQSSWDQRFSLILNLISQMSVATEDVAQQCSSCVRVRSYCHHHKKNSVFFKIIFLDFFCVCVFAFPWVACQKVYSILHRTLELEQWNSLLHNPE